MRWSYGNGKKGIWFFFFFCETANTEKKKVGLTSAFVIAMAIAASLPSEADDTQDLSE